MRAWEIENITESGYSLSDNEKQWVNPSKKQMIVIPIAVHHTQFAHGAPQKFGLSGNLFKDYQYPVDDKGEPVQYDINIAKEMFDAGWVRTRTYPLGSGTSADVHCLDMKTAALALRMLKQKFNDLSSSTIEIGPDNSAKNKSVVLRNNEDGTGQLKTFIRTGKVVDQSKVGEFREDMKARNVIGSAIRVDEIPQKYRDKYTMIGRGSTSLVYEYDADNVLVFTRDTMKEEWLRVALQISEYIDEFDVRGVSRIQGMSDIPIMVFKMTKLFPLNPANKKRVKQEISQFDDIKWKLMNSGKRDWNHDLLNYYYEHHPDSVIMEVVEWFANYDVKQFHFDFLVRNFMQTKDGDIIPSDPVISTEVYDLIQNRE